MVALKSRSKRNGTMQFRSIREAAAYANLPYMTVYMRLRMKWPLSQALKVPVHRKSRRYVVQSLIGAR